MTVEEKASAPTGLAIQSLRSASSILKRGTSAPAGRGRGRGRGRLAAQAMQGSGTSDAKPAKVRARIDFGRNTI